MKTMIITIFILSISFNSVFSCAKDGMTKARNVHHAAIMSI